MHVYYNVLNISNLLFKPKTYETINDYRFQTLLLLHTHLVFLFISSG